MDLATDFKWPEIFPKNCPPSDAQPSVGAFYRVILDKPSATLKKKHFESQKQSQPNRTTWPDKYCPCGLCGVSILSTLEDSRKLARELMDNVPGNSRRVALLAIGTLQENMGKIKHSPDIENELQSHYDWWLPENLDPTPAFSFIGEVVNNE